ncbi:DNA internalization-related competence protein ComEC/Rec2 [hydrothermal vent metagenome]|uniref:DNA internalization-related competence protein ComEC/Rec2 n=1 Tax=hydrothermal vent metagenome TaxID=652676 RepID=A0A3B1B871_9ZZZZ
MRSGWPLRTGVIAFLAGILSLQHVQVLPAIEWSILLLPAIVLAVWLPGFWRLTGWWLAGVFWMLLQAQLILVHSLPVKLEGKDVLVRGRISSLPEQNFRRTRFEFELESLSRDGRIYSSPGRVRLSWYRVGKRQNLHAGQYWQLQVRLKRPQGLMNPGGFDYEGWLFQHRIRATGYIRKSHKNHKLTDVGSSCFLLCLREKIRDHIIKITHARNSTGLLLALSIGERSLITPVQWQWLRKTGTSHLVAISGLHIGLVAGLMFLLLNRLWRFSGRVMLYCPAPKAAAWGAMAAALVYAALAGFSVPTQRALIMLSVVMLGIIFNRPLSPGRTLALALLAVLIIDPLAVMSAGFWLSFLAVWVIVYGLAARVGKPGKWQQWWRSQAWVTLGLMPVLLLFFQQVSLIAPLANVLAIPLVSLLIAPLSLLGSLLLFINPDWAAFLLLAAAWLLDRLSDYLSWLAGLPFATWSAAVLSLPALILSLFGMLWLLAPQGIPARWLGGVMLLPVLFARFVSPLPEQARFTLLDVGQGLAAVVQTRNHVLVFDTGARFGKNFNMGDAVLIPFLRQRGIRQVDRLILSHADNDHLGGAASLLAQIPVQKILASNPQRARKKGIVQPIEPCHSGQQWNWDGVVFRILHPPPRTRLRRNNRSCVLQIVAGGQSLLLSGDIEKAAEHTLVRRYGDKLRAEILVVPHHGSKTSSTAAFIDSVSPRYALFPTGYRNRYGFPHPSVLARYHLRKIPLYQTWANGAISFTLGVPAGALQPQLFRQRQGHFWNSF